LSPISKGEVPLDTYHIDHLGQLSSIKKSYNHVFLIVDAFSKFVWLYATKTTYAAEVLSILKKQSIIFGNPRRIISDRGAAFTSNDFQSYCREKNIEHVLITTEMSRSNGQIE
jgi:transposase InsO family protein